MFVWGDPQTLARFTLLVLMRGKPEMTNFLCTVAMACVLGVGSDGPDAKTVRRNVDLIELNHFVDKQGREVFRQLIFFDWSPQAKRFHVRSWRLLNDDSQIPIRRWNPDGFECSWVDDDFVRYVRSPQMRETWTQEDPERANRKFLPEDQRRPLFEDDKVRIARLPSE
jgi:hypothetical protein